MADAGTSSVEQQEINLTGLSLEQLNSLKSQLEQELQQLSSSFTGLREAQTRFGESKESLSSLQKSEEGKQVLVPLTSSMFAPAKLADVNDVLVDIGTGYYVQHDVDNAKQFMDRKVAFLQQNLDALKEVLENKRTMLQNVVMVMQYKMQATQQSQSS